MFYFKACTKCHGALFQDRDIYGPYIACMQCSRYLNEAEEAKLKLLALGPAMHHLGLAQKEKVAV